MDIKGIVKEEVLSFVVKYTLKDNVVRFLKYRKRDAKRGLARSSLRK
jgi:hypothetical protein